MKAEDQISTSACSICPYCQEEDAQIEGEDYSEDEYELECSHCDKKYYVHQQFEISHHSRGDCELNGEEHDYQPVTLRSGESAPFCTKCDKCQPYNERN